MVGRCARDRNRGASPSSLSSAGCSPRFFPDRDLRDVSPFGRDAAQLPSRLLERARDLRRPRISASAPACARVSALRCAASLSRPCRCWCRPSTSRPRAEALPPRRRRLVFFVLTERAGRVGAVAVSGLGAAVAVGVLPQPRRARERATRRRLARDQGRARRSSSCSHARSGGSSTASAVDSSAHGCARPDGRPVEPARAPRRARRAIVAADPVERFETVQAPPRRDVAAIDGGDFVAGPSPQRERERPLAVLVRGGRPVAGDPVAGDGAGSYESWWAEHASFTYFVRDAHSLYLEALGELGSSASLLAVGLVLVGGSPSVPAVRSARGASERVTSRCADSRLRRLRGRRRHRLGLGADRRERRRRRRARARQRPGDCRLRASRGARAR